MLTISAQLREETGKAASRRLRRQGGLPAVLYGLGHPSVALTLSHDGMNHAQEHDRFYTQPLQLEIQTRAGGVEVAEVSVQALQRHPFKPKLLHIDFIRRGA